MISKEIHEGKDGWIFLTGGSNQSLDLFSSKKTPFTSGILSNWEELLRRRSTRAANLGARYLHLIAPEKLSVYPEFYIGDLEVDVRPGAQLQARAQACGLSNVLIDPVAFYGKVNPNIQLYWKTDTHWTYWGCFAAYQLLMSRFGLQANPSLAQRPFHEGEVQFDLGAKLHTPRKETARFYQPVQNAERVFANQLVEFQESNRRFSEIELHVGTSVIYHNTSPDAIDARIVLFGDSFSEYRPHLLTGLLAETFRETHFLWTTNLDFDYVEQVRPDYLVTESAERFMSRVPTDDVNFEQYVRDRLHHLGIKN
ncbi:hypothetical protein MASR1M32_37900 [Rhodobacter sp.]